MRGQAGFTLIELGLVILIIAVTLGIVIPRLGDRGHADLSSQARRLASTMQLLKDEAILYGRVHRLNYDLTQQRYWADLSDDSSGANVFIAKEGSLGAGVALPESIAFADITMPEIGVQVADGAIWTLFYPDGTSDPTFVHLSSDDEVYTVEIDLYGRVFVSAGYVLG